MRTREEQIAEMRQDLRSGKTDIVEWEDMSKQCIATTHIREAERRAEQRVRAEIGRDSERLDWLERGFKSCTAYMNGDVAFSHGISVRNLRGPDFRSAIDAAREVKE